MVGHQVARPVRADDLHLVADPQVAQIIRSDAGDGLARVVFGHALHRQRDVVVARTLAVARARHRVEPHVVRPAAGVDARRQDAERLAFEHRERRRAEIEDDVPDIRRRAVRRQPVIARHRRDRRLVLRIQVHVRMRRRPRRRRGPALSGGRDFRQLPDVARDVGLRVHLEVGGRRQRVPRELVVERVRRGLLHLMPVIDRAGRAWRNACIAAVALREVDDVVARIVRDGADRAGRLAGVAANADLRIDQVLQRVVGARRGGRHRLSLLVRNRL